MTNVRTWGNISLSTIKVLIVVGLVGSAFYYLWKNVAVADDRARSAKQDRSSPETSRASADAKAGVAADPQTSRAEIEKQLA